jgi:hypothetical protein
MPITRKDGSILCRKCNLFLGLLEDQGVAIRFGNVRLYGFRVKYFCAGCGKVYHFTETNLGNHNTADFPPETHEILNGLGKSYLTTQEQRDNAKHYYHQKPDDDKEQD